MAERTAALDATTRRLHLGSPKVWARALGVLAVLSFAAAVPLSLLSQQLDSGVIVAVIGVPCAAVGWLVTRRQPGNPIGWLFLVTRVFMFLCTAGGDYGYYVYLRRRGLARHRGDRSPPRRGSGPPRKRGPSLRGART